MGDGAGGEAPWILSAFSRERGGICPARSVLRRTASSSRKETCQNGGAPVRACLASLEALQRECEDLRGRRKRTTAENQAVREPRSLGAKQRWQPRRDTHVLYRVFYSLHIATARTSNMVWTRPEPVQEGARGIFHASEVVGSSTFPFFCW